MPYTLNTPEDQRAMLESIGVSSIKELFDVIPEALRLKEPLNLPVALGEMELTAHMTRLAAKNSPAGAEVSFLGAGSYDHFIPAVVDAIASRTEFYSSYTPYQPEVSQGNLQAMFEYQTLITQLTGMDVSNTSLYDGGSAAAEAAILCMHATGRAGKIVVPASVHPEYRQIVKTYFANQATEVVTVPTPNGAANPEDIARAIDEETACVLLQHPNFFGTLEQVQEIADVAHRAGALLVQSFDPISLGLLRRPGDCGVDVAIAEGQSLGSPMAFGGPYLGIMATREKFLRRMPGRISGQTVDRRGRRCFVLTLQTREQHIRRERATSNICTNQGLYALRTAVYLAVMGPSGMREVAELCLQKSAYAREQFANCDRFDSAFDGPTFKEFVVRDGEGHVQSLLSSARAEGIHAGVPLGRWYPELDDCLLVAVTEKRSRREIDRLISCLSRNSRPAAIVHA